MTWTDRPRSLERKQPLLGLLAVVAITGMAWAAILYALWAVVA